MLKPVKGLDGTVKRLASGSMRMETAIIVLIPSVSGNGAASRVLGLSDPPETPGVGYPTLQSF